MANKPTLQQRYTTYLMQQGYEVVPSRSVRKVCLKKAGLTYYLGKGGSIRLSRTGKVTDSYDVSERMKPRLIAWEESNIRNHAHIN